MCCKSISPVQGGAGLSEIRCNKGAYDPKDRRQDEA